MGILFEGLTVSEANRFLTSRSASVFDDFIPISHAVGKGAKEQNLTSLQLAVSSFLSVLARQETIRRSRRCVPGSSNISTAFYASAQQPGQEEDDSIESACELSADQALHLCHHRCHTTGVLHG